MRSLKVKFKVLGFRPYLTEVPKISLFNQNMETKIIDELINQLNDFKNSKLIKNCDLSDLGNEIGIVIGNYTNDKIGFDKDDFIHGIKHGISISDGTHRF